MRSSVIVALLVLAASPALAEPPGKAARRCIAGLNASGTRGAVAAARRFAACVRDAGKGLVPPASCATPATHATLERAQARTRKLAASRCSGPPPFGPPDADTVNAAFMSLLHPDALFGPDLASALAPAGDDPGAAACQAAVAGALARFATAKLGEFGACVSKGLRQGRIDSAAAIGTCDQRDPSARVSRAIDRANRIVRRKCAATPVARAFPGDCAGVPLDGLLACVERCAACDVCLAVDAANGVDRTCPHVFAGGVAQPYCGQRPVETHSVARLWNEELLDAIRRDTPRPTVHARNLFHVSAAMYDAWVAYSGGPEAPWLVHEKPASADVAADRDAAISFAAYRILSARFATSPGRDATLAAFDGEMLRLGYDRDFTSTAGDSGPAVGNRIAAAMLAFGMTDGANEERNYADPTYAPVNAPMIVKEAGAVMADPNRWQPLALDVIIAQNGIPLPDKVQTFIGARWGGVTPFALGGVEPDAVDLGGPPLLGTASDAEFKAQMLEIVRFSSRLDPADGATIDLSPGARGNNPLGTNDGTGYPANPATGAPYEPNVVRRADWARVLAEFWADGPSSETPPGHWNTIANSVSDHPLVTKQIGGAGPVVPDLEWDVKLYFALNGAVHDAAIAAWGQKRRYDSARPVSGIRWLGGRGELPLEEGVVEAIVPDTTIPGGRHAHLVGHEGELAVRAWPGEPDDPETQVSGTRWMLATRWVPYQKKTFVTPAFPGYISGHSTFSRSAAEVMTSFTGSPFFPGGLGEFHAARDAYLTFEKGPTTDVVMQWASYYDAADEAGTSRRYGGIHIAADDFHGRRAGSRIGTAAFALAARYFAGAAP